MNMYLLNAILLFSFSIPVVMYYRILPIQGTPYWLFGVLFFMLIIHVLASFFQERLREKFRVPMYTLLTCATIGIVLVGVVTTAIVDRHLAAPIFGVHDIILQQEAAMRFLIEGKNPYKETYFGTPMEQWNYGELGVPAVNPALYHFVMPPWYVIFPFSIYFLTIPILGYFDGRMALLLCMLGLLYILYRWFQQKGLGLLAITLTALSPATVSYFIEGRSDVFALFWFVWSLYLLDKKHIFVSAIIFGLAILSKQTIWFAAPVYLLYVWLSTKKHIGKTLVSLGLIFGCVAALSAPFLLWDARAFIESTVLYLSGSALHSYPVSGYGLGMVLYDMKIIANIHDQYPFILWQLSLGMPVLLCCLWMVYRKKSMSLLLLGYGVTLFVWWYTSRYFNNSHLGYLSSIFVLAGLKRLEEQNAL